MKVSTSKSFTMKGPVAMGQLLGSVSASTSMIEYSGSEMLARKAAFSTEVWKMTSWPSASMLSSLAAVTARSWMDMARSKLFFTASPSTGLPLWKVTPSRMCSFQVSSSICSQESASWGTSS